MLPPDSENKSVFGKMIDIVKSFVSNPFSNEMLTGYMNHTIDAMFYELDIKELVEIRFKSFNDFFSYLSSVYYPIYNATNIYDVFYYDSNTKRIEFIKVCI